eukprot:snap_masked-scaffold_44-processed-gene-1.84-mRNA-1 protein AED:1.00 eAED:1.00 QI:0/0/0/0/1/1/2/0/101
MRWSLFRVITCLKALKNIHGNIKPDLISLFNNYIPKLSDFRVSRKILNLKKNTKNKLVERALDFLAPEHSGFDTEVIKGVYLKLLFPEILQNILKKSERKV